MKASHCISNPSDTFSVAGCVPETCIQVETPPTIPQVMGGRVFKRDGLTFGWNDKSFSSRESAAAAVLAGGGKLCSCCKWGTE